MTETITALSKQLIAPLSKEAFATTGTANTGAGSPVLNAALRLHCDATDHGSVLSSEVCRLPKTRAVPLSILTHDLPDAACSQAPGELRNDLAWDEDPCKFYGLAINHGVFSGAADGPLRTPLQQVYPNLNASLSRAIREPVFAP